MSNYLYFQHVQDSLIDRFNFQDRSELRGLSEWRELLTRLLDVIIAREEQNSSDTISQQHRATTISELIALTDKDFSVYLERADFTRSTEELIATLLLQLLPAVYSIQRNRLLLWI
jgi:hypothetical protein